MSTFNRISLRTLSAFPHGVRARYIAGCRCPECRQANTAYEKQRRRAQAKGDWNGLVDAAPVRRHLLRLSRAGVGRRTVCEIAGVASGVYGAIRWRGKRKVRARTARRLLAVSADALNDAKLLPAGRTWRMLRSLLDEGFTRTELARRLGSRARVPALQIRSKRVTARTAMRVEKLYRQIMEA